MLIRRFKEADADAVSRLIIETVRISNTKDYPVEMMEELVKREQPADVLKRASWTHFYVVESDDQIIGCGAIGPYWDKQDESSLFTIFVLPEYQGRGIGRMIVETLEKDEYALRAKRIEIPASITGLPFYQKMGYTFKNGQDKPDEEKLYRLEKYTDPVLIEYYASDNQEHWLNEIKQSDWNAGQFLYELLRDNRLKKLCGESTKVLLLTDGDALVSFCTYAEQDDIREPALTPWVGFVYTFPEYRGKRCIGKLFDQAYDLAKRDKYEHIYISTGETGLYEKYGYSFWKTMKDMHGEDSRVYRIDVERD
ncbi:MAG: GNAT family N-acetyltransferase [Lachnospiraceae bacterium]|nr:GNAT family N-acetyltransferase [Lachnospiraceae bacterium]